MADKTIVRHILVVDDEVNILRTMEFILEVANYRVTLAENAYQALKQIQECKNGDDAIDLMITDVKMPGMTGIELIDHVRSQGLELPILVMTEYGSRRMLIELIRRGCTDYIDKPIDDEELLQRLEIIFRKTKRQPG